MGQVVKCTVASTVSTIGYVRGVIGEGESFYRHDAFVVTFSIDLSTLPFLPR